MIKAFLFDVDGVLNQTEPFSVQYSKITGLPAEAFRLFFKGIFQACSIGQLDLKEIIQPYLKEWKWKGSANELIDFWVRSENYPNQRVLEIVKDLIKKGHRCFVASNQEKYRASYMAKQMGFEKIFKKLFFSCSIGFRKTNPEFFKKVLSETKTKPEETLFIDDEEEHTNAAKSLGIETFLYSNFEDFEKFIKKFL